MLISTKGRYALRMLLDLAIHRAEGFIALKDIAERQNISKKYLEQIVPLLNKADLLKTNRGYQGGYALIREWLGSNENRESPRVMADFLYGIIRKLMQMQ